MQEVGHMRNCWKFCPNIPSKNSIKQFLIKHVSNSSNGS